jgi:hypothetical protein
VARLLVTHAREHVEVEVDVPRPHAADVQGHHRPEEISAALHVVADDHGNGACDLEVLPRVPRARTLETLFERGAIEGVTLRPEEDG